MEEVWKDIKGFEGLYQVSNLGKIKSLPKWRARHHSNEMVLKECNDKNGYSMVNLYKNGRRKTYKVHKLVAENFIPNSKNKTQVNHINGNKKDNSVTNLEWCSPYENVKHAWDIGLCVNTPLPPIKRRKVNQYSLDGKFIKTWEDIRSASKKLGINYRGIIECCRNRQKTAYGFNWKYTEEKYQIEKR